MAIWEFLSDTGNREVLSWVGGGLVVIFGGLWTVVTFFRKPAAAPAGGARIVYGLTGWPLVTLIATLASAVVLMAALDGPRVTATNGGVGIGGGVSGGAITTNR